MASSDSGSCSAIVLAGGKGTRMKSDLPKVLHEIDGCSMLGWVVAAIRGAGVADICLIASEDLWEHERFPRGEYDRVVAQLNRAGTADAVASASMLYPAFPRPAYASGKLLAGEPIESDYTLICAGDIPAITSTELKRFVAKTIESSADLAVLGMDVPDPFGYGRIVSEGDRVVAIVEELSLIHI